MSDLLVHLYSVITANIKQKANWLRQRYYLLYSIVFYNIIRHIPKNGHLKSIFLSTHPQINTSIYPTIKFSLSAAPKTQKIRGPGFTSKSSESLIFQAFSHSQLCTLVNRTTLSTCPVQGNISTGQTPSARYPCFVRYFKSLARVSGPQEI